MKLVKHTDPWEYYTVDNFLTLDQVHTLYTLCDEGDPSRYDSYFMMNGDIQNQASVDINMSQELSDIIKEKLQWLLTDLDLVTPNFDWGFSTNVTYPKLDVQLMPHNDDFVELGKYGAGKIKVLVYLGKNDIPYKGWGTRLYTSELVEDFAKEVEYVPGRAFIFKPVANTYHGTQFNKELEGPRYMLGAEYMEKKNG
jgi:hypothetical protein|tara:strand:+ start:86 stop:676 length:591 start_codon:yes stop_codon:yes gene_type:complete